MAIYSCSVKTIKRSSGQTSVASAAYRAGECLEDSRIGKTFDYQNKKGVIATEIFAPQEQNVSSWVFDRQTLWNEVEQAEKRINSTVAREVLVALPHELNQQERKELASEFSQWLADKYQVITDMAIHKPSKDGDDRNYHAHIMVTPRVIENEAFAKVKSYTNDKGKTVRKLALDYGGKRGSEEVTAIREKWGKSANDFLTDSGSTAKIDHRTLENQGIDRQASFHLGHEVTAMERKGIVTEVKQRFDEIIHNNEYLQQVRSAAQRASQWAINTQEAVYQRFQQYTKYLKHREETLTPDERSL